MLSRNIKYAKYSYNVVFLFHCFQVITLFKTSWRARRCLNKKFRICLVACNTPRPPMSVHKKFQPNQSSHFAGYVRNIFIYAMSCFIKDYRIHMHCKLLFISQYGADFLSAIKLLYTTAQIQLWFNYKIPKEISLKK